MDRATSSDTELKWRGTNNLRSDTLPVSFNCEVFPKHGGPTDGEGVGKRWGVHHRLPNQI